MPGLKLAFTLAAAAYAFGKYIFSEDDTPPPPPPPRDSYYPSSSYNSGTTRTQTQQSYRPPPSPPSPPNNYQPPAKNAYSQTTVRTPALSDHSRGIRYPSLPYTGTPSQSQLSSSAHNQTTVRTPTLSDHGRGVHHPSIPYTGTPSQLQPSSSAHNQNTAKTSPPHDYDRGVYISSVSSPYGRTPGQTQLSSTRTQASRQHSCACGQHVFELPEYEDEDEDEYRYEDEDDYEYQDEYEYGYQDEGDYGYQDEGDYEYEEDDYGYQDEDEDEYRHEGEDEYEEDEYEDQNGDEYEYLQTTSHIPSRVHTGGKPHLPIAPVGGVSSHPLFDEPAGVEDLELAKKLREQARRKGREMSEAYRRAKSAKKKGRLGAAHAHRQDAIAHESKMKELDKRAAKIFFGENNKNRREGGKIDLHGLHVDEALQFAEDQLQTARSRGDEVVRFIVGKGLHSDAGEAKIRPALEKSFTNRGLIHSLDPYNAGVLVVQLDRV